MRRDHVCLVIVIWLLEVVIVVVVLANAQDSLVGNFCSASEFILSKAGFLAAHRRTIMHCGV